MLAPLRMMEGRMLAVWKTAEGKWKRMIPMILKMSAITALYVILTAFIWKCCQNKKITFRLWAPIGMIYGLCSVLSTHFAVDFSDMLLNVRDIGPLAAGLFFHPAAGIVAGLIGGIERFIAGTYWGIGSYTRIACSVSTCLAGFFAALLHTKVFKGKKPSAIYAFFMGAVMEVFHMYVVFITHREDMKMAFYVVRVCSIPMIIFTGLGLAASSIVLKVMMGEWKNPLRHFTQKVKQEEIPLSSRFQAWLFFVTVFILLVNFGFSFTLQRQSSMQNARDTLASQAESVKATYAKVKRTYDGMEIYAQLQAVTDAQAIAKSLEKMGGLNAADRDYLEELRQIYRLDAIYVLDEKGHTLVSVGNEWQGQDAVSSASVQEGLTSWEEKAETMADGKIAAYVKCGNGAVQAVMDQSTMAILMNLTDRNETFAMYQDGDEGTFALIDQNGLVVSGPYIGEKLDEELLSTLRGQEQKKLFIITLFGEEVYCRTEELEDGLLLNLILASEVYDAWITQAYETALADILLFTVIYMLISYLVQQIVVNNLSLVNQSLDKITKGNLDEVVSVRNSSEFASLSDDINETVSVLKGYIEAAEKRIEQELIFAATIQDSALPKNFIFPRHDFDLYATMDPAKEVGGDFYDFFFVEEDKLALVIADVSGKGIPASLFMMRGKTAIRSLAESGSSPADILYKANNTLCEGNEAEMFITAWIGIVDLKTGLMTCANAGHEYPVLMRAGEDWALYKDRHTLALAAIQGIRAKEYEIQLYPGDKLFVYTDGIPEAINEQVEQYGAERMIQVLNTLKDAPMKDVLPIVRKDIADFAGNAEQFDDITMLGFAYNGPEKEP